MTKVIKPSGVLHENLKNVRKEKGYTQAELAELLNVSRQTISNWECGQSIPDVASLKQLQQYLDVPLEVLLGRSATQEVVERSGGLSDEAIAQQLAKLTTFYAAEFERRKNAEKKMFAILVVLTMLILISILFFAFAKFYFYPTRIELTPIVVEPLSTD